VTIQLTIRLFGTLGSKVPNYDHEKGLLVNAADNATPEDLARGLKIPLDYLGFISDGCSAIELDARLTDKMSIHFFSLMSGG
jgi:hypothetical protein